jgi:hypothetical protein
MASSVAAVGGGSGSVPASPLWAWFFFFCVWRAGWLASGRAVAGSGRVVVEERGLGKLTRSCGRENY